MDSSSHPLYLDKEYDTKESFLAACIKHNTSVGKECKVGRSNTIRVKLTCSDDSCHVRIMGDSAHVFFSYSSFLPAMIVLCVVSCQQQDKEMESDIT